MGVGDQVVADPVGVPVGAAEEVLDAVRRLVAGLLGELPAVLALGVGEQAAEIRDGPPPRLRPGEAAGHQREQVIKPGNPRRKIIIRQHTPDYTETGITKCCCRY